MSCLPVQRGWLRSQFCSWWQDAVVWMWARVWKQKHEGKKQAERQGRRRESTQDLKTAFFFLYNRYSPVLIQALCWQCHLHRDRRGGIPVHLSTRLHGWKLPPAARTMLHKQVTFSSSKGILSFFVWPRQPIETPWHCGYSVSCGLSAKKHIGCSLFVSAQNVASVVVVACNRQEGVCTFVRQAETLSLIQSLHKTLSLFLWGLTFKSRR